MSTYRTEWDAISQYIKGLMEAGSMIIQLRNEGAAAPQNELKAFIMPSAMEIFNRINQFKTAYTSQLPIEATAAIETFLKRHQGKFYDLEKKLKSPSTESFKDSYCYCVPCLATFRSEMNYLLSDTQAVIRRITERAFIHLQQSIVVDGDVRSKWKHAFDESPRGEPSCEKLGAVHLLLHGIWSFKAHSTAAETDLVLGEPLDLVRGGQLDPGVVARSAEGLVLTEWKALTSDDNSERDRKAKVAFEQAKLYNGGVLGAVELRNYRYLVLVSRKRIVIPDPREDAGITYRHINIAVDPGAVSKEAPRLASAGQHNAVHNTSPD